jgi:hypothetical protein
MNAKMSLRRGELDRRQTAFAAASFALVVFHTATSLAIRNCSFYFASIYEILFTKYNQQRVCV